VLYELVFDQLALIGATEAQRIAPENYVGHRMLADAYRKRPRHLIASASEQLQSQLLQPLNNNPAPVQLLDSNLSSFRDSGPFSTSFNEYRRLFTRDGITGKVATTIGSNNTHSKELQISALKTRLSATLTAFNFGTDGIRVDSGEDEELVTTLLQTDISDRLGIQFEYLHSAFNSGDDFIGFDRTRAIGQSDFIFNNDRWRLGTRAVLKDSHLVLMHIEAHQSEKSIHFPREFIRRTVFLDSNHLELRHNRLRTSIPATSGLRIGSENAERVNRNNVGVFRSGEDRHYGDAYIYIYPSLTIQNDLILKFTVGVKQSIRTKESGSNSTTSPKFSLETTWRNTSLRLASYRSLATSEASLRSIEPTHVASFVQDREDISGTESTNYGIGIDSSAPLVNKSLGLNFQIGMEHLHRNYRLEDNKPFNESFSTAYINVIGKSISSKLSLKRQIYNSKDNESPSRYHFVDARTHRLDLDVGLFFPHQFHVKLNQTYIHQKGIFFDIYGAENYPGNDSFWLTGLSLRKRFSTIAGNKIHGSFSLSIENIFDKAFNFQDTDPFRPSIAYGKTATLQVKLDSI